MPYLGTNNVSPYLDTKALTLYGPVVYRGLSDQGNRFQVDPLPEDDFIGHRVCLHFALHLNVEYLQCLTSCRRITQYIQE